MAQVHRLHRSHVRIAMDLGQMETMAHSRRVGGIHSRMHSSDCVLAPPTSLPWLLPHGDAIFPFHRSPHFHPGPDGLLFRLSDPHGLDAAVHGQGFTQDPTPRQHQDELEKPPKQWWP